MNLIQEYSQIIRDFEVLYNRQKTAEKSAGELEMSKKEKILQLKDNLLKQGTAPEKISAAISQALKKWVDPSYVSKCLGDEFKQEKYVTEKNKAKKAILISTEGTVQHEEEPPITITSPPKGETREEKRKREFEEWQARKNYKAAGKESRKMDRAEGKQEQQQTQQPSRNPYTGPSIGPPPKKDTLEEEEETSYFITITDTDIIDEIVLLRTQQNVMRIRLEVDAADRTVMGIRQNR